MCLTVLTSKSIIIASTAAAAALAAFLALSASLRAVLAPIETLSIPLLVEALTVAKYAALATT